MKHTSSSFCSQRYSVGKLEGRVCVCTEEVRQGQKVINEMITCLYKPNGDHTKAFSPLYPQAFIIVINSLDSPDNMLTNKA